MNMLDTKKKKPSSTVSVGKQKTKSDKMKPLERQPGSSRTAHGNYVLFPVAPSQSRSTFTFQPLLNLSTPMQQHDNFYPKKSAYQFTNDVDLGNSFTEPHIELFYTRRPILSYGAFSDAEIHSISSRAPSAAFYNWVSDSETEYIYRDASYSGEHSVPREKDPMNSCLPIYGTCKTETAENNSHRKYFSAQREEHGQIGLNQKVNGSAFYNNCLTPNPKQASRSNTSGPHQLKYQNGSHKIHQQSSAQDCPGNISRKYCQTQSSHELSPGSSLAMTAATVGVSSFWVGPLTVLYWCATWYLSGHYVFRDNEKLSAGVCALFGYCVLFLVTCFQAKLESCVTGVSSSPIRFLLSRLYTYVVALACVAQWRGLWTLLDIYLKINLTSSALSGAVAIMLLLLMRSYVSVLGAPAVVKPDIPLESHFHVPTFFGIQPDCLSIVWDSLFTVFVVGSLIIGVWRGVWEVLDVRLYPSDTSRSGLSSLAIAYGLIILLALFQARLSRLSAYLDSVHWLLKLLLEDFVYILQSIVNITHWRGFWVLLEEYDSYRPESAIVLHGISFFLMTVTYAAQNLMVKGSSRDGAMPEGQGVKLNVSYLTSLSQACRSKNKDQEN